MLSSIGSAAVIAATLMLAALPRVLAHGHDLHIDPTPVSATGLSISPSPTQVSVHTSASGPSPSYFDQPSQGLMLAHITLMTVDWLLVLPLCRSTTS